MARSRTSLLGAGFLAGLMADLALTAAEPWLDLSGVVTPFALGLTVLTFAWTIAAYRRASRPGPGGLYFSHARAWQLILLPVVNLYLIHGVLQAVWHATGGPAPRRETTALCVAMAAGLALELAPYAGLPELPLAMGLSNAAQDVLWIRLVLALEPRLSGT